MRHYFEKMTPIGRAINENERREGKANALDIARVDQEIEAAAEKRSVAISLT